MKYSLILSFVLFSTESLGHPQTYFNNQQQAYFNSKINRNYDGRYPYLQQQQYQPQYSYQFVPTAQPNSAELRNEALPNSNSFDFTAISSSSTPTAAAALAYTKAAGGDDICAKSTIAYLDIIVKGGSAEAATSVATAVYRKNYNTQPPARGSACAASEESYRSGKDPVLSAAQAFINNWPGVKEGNPCAVAGKDYVTAFIAGSSSDEASRIAAKSFGASFEKLALQGKELKDPACAAATKAFLEVLPNKPSGPSAAAMLAFIDKALSGFSLQYDPVCWKAAEAFMDSFALDSDETSSKVAAAEAFFDEFANTGSGLPADSPCTAAALAYSDNLNNIESKPNKAAMVAFIQKLTSAGKNAPDPVCAAATQAFWETYNSGASEDKARIAGAEAFIKGFAAGNRITSDSACVAAARAYSDALPKEDDSTTNDATMIFLNSLTTVGNLDDPACSAASLAFIDSYKAGNSELKSYLTAALAFIKIYKTGAVTPANSPCLTASKAVASSIKNSPSPHTLAAMLAFIDETSKGDTEKPDTVCLEATEAFLTAFVNGASEDKAADLAGIAFVDAVGASPSFDPKSRCGAAARAYMKNFNL